MKVPIDFDGMTNNQLLALARKCIREHNDRGWFDYKVVRK